MLSRIKKRLLDIRRNADVRHAAMITFATIAAQVVLFGTTPILARLFAPGDFGRLGLLMTVMTIGGGVAAFSFHFVVLLPRSERIAAAAFRLSIYLAVLGSAIATLVYYVATRGNHGILPDAPMWVELLMVAVGVFGTSNFSVFGTALSRANLYGTVSISKFNLSLMSTIYQVAFGLLGLVTFGLQGGRILGQMTTNAIMSRNLPPAYRMSQLLRPRFAELRYVMKNYRDTLLHVPRDLLLRAGSGLPAALMLGAYGPTIAGFYFFAERLVERPGILLSDSLTRLPMKIFAEKVREKQPILKAALLYTMISASVIVVGLAILVVGGPWLFGVAFGHQWLGAVDYANALAAGTGARVGILPMLALVPVLRIQRYIVILDSIFFLRVFIIPLCSRAGLSAVEAVWIVAGTTVAYSICTFIIVSRAALKHDQGLAAKA